jgi:hypothetical protein
MNLPLKGPDFSICCMIKFLSMGVAAIEQAVHSAASLGLAGPSCLFGFSLSLSSESGEFNYKYCILPIHLPRPSFSLSPHSALTISPLLAPWFENASWVFRLLTRLQVTSPSPPFSPRSRMHSFAVMPFALTNFDFRSRFPTHRTLAVKNPRLRPTAAHATIVS